MTRIDRNNEFWIDVWLKKGSDIYDSWRYVDSKPLSLMNKIKGKSIQPAIWLFKGQPPEPNVYGDWVFKNWSTSYYDACSGMSCYKWLWVGPVPPDGKPPKPFERDLLPDEEQIYAEYKVKLQEESARKAKETLKEERNKTEKDVCKRGCDAALAQWRIENPLPPQGGGSKKRRSLKNRRKFTRRYRKK